MVIVVTLTFPYQQMILNFLIHSHINLCSELPSTLMILELPISYHPGWFGVLYVFYAHPVTKWGMGCPWITNWEKRLQQLS